MEAFRHEFVRHQGKADIRTTLLHRPVSSVAYKGSAMFEHKSITKAVLGLFLEYSAKLEKSARVVRDKCGSLDEYLTYQNEVD